MSVMPAEIKTQAVTANLKALQARLTVAANQRRDACLAKPVWKAQSSDRHCARVGYDPGRCQGTIWCGDGASSFESALR